MRHLKIIIFTIFLTACSIIDQGKIPLETNTKGFETAGIRVGSVTTKYQVVNSTVKENLTVQEKGNCVEIKTWVIFTIIALIVLYILHKGGKYAKAFYRKFKTS